MGLVRMGPPRELILLLKERYGLEDFIETGTYHGDTASWAASHFDRVTTIEYARWLYEQTRARYGWIRNIDFLFGDSREVLKAIVPKLSQAAVFWLDGHWSGGRTYGQSDECPLIEEIKAINASEHTHFLFIDDARLFTSPPPKPHRIEQWPTVDEVIGTLKSARHQCYIVIIDDIIIAVPDYAKPLVAEYCQEANTKAWETFGKRQEDNAARDGLRMIFQGVRLLGQGLYKSSHFFRHRISLE